MSSNKLHPLSLPELLTEIFSYLAEDKTLYPTLFVNRLWYLCSAPILWRKAEFTGELTNTCMRWRKFKKVICGKYKPHAPFLLRLHLSSCKVSNDVLYVIAGSCPNLHHLKIRWCCGLSNKVISKIAQ